MTAVRCTAPARGHVPGSQAQRECPVHGNRAGASFHSTPAAPIAPAPEPTSRHRQTVRSDGTVVEGWYRNGVLHREDGPAYVERRPDGTVVEGWRKNGVLHREGGPARVERHPDGTVIEEWHRNGRGHREDGPAYVERRPDGTVEPWAWCLDNTGVEPWEVLGRYLRRRGVPGLSAEALKQIVRDMPWQRWSELGSDHPLVALWGTVHPSAEINAD